jgi:hypothetical protein
VAQLEGKVDKAKATASYCRAEADAAHKESAKLSSELDDLKTKSTEGDAKVRGKVSRARALLSDASREFGACTASLDDEEEADVGKRFVGWIKEELGSLTIVVRA